MIHAYWAVVSPLCASLGDGRRVQVTVAHVLARALGPRGAVYIYSQLLDPSSTLWQPHLLPPYEIVSKFLQKYSSSAAKQQRATTHHPPPSTTVTMWRFFPLVCPQEDGEESPAPPTPQMSLPLPPPGIIPPPPPPPGQRVFTWLELYGLQGSALTNFFNALSQADANAWLDQHH
jgi:hypothetical protein